MKNLKLILFLLLITQISFAQEQTVFGVVKDTFGLAFPGVNVIVKGTTISTQTDFDGKFAIKAILNQVLVFSCASHENQSVTATQNEINVVLSPYDDSNDCIGRQHSMIRIQKPKYVAVYKKDYRKLKRAEKELKRDLKNKDNPKYNFKKAKNYALSKVGNGYFNIFQKDDCNYRSDEGFQNKYHIIYNLPNGLSDEYAKAFNKLVFKHLNKKYKKTWQSKIRKDVYGLDEFLKLN